MPTLTWSQSVAAGATFEPLANWQYEFAPEDCAMEVFHDASATGVLVTITSGSETIQEESPVSGTATPGNIPCRFDVEPVLDKCVKGDKIKLRYRNTGGGAATVNGQITLMPLPTGGK